MSWPVHRWLILCGISSLVFKGCQGFFLRHTKSEKCIAAGSPISENDWGSRTWAEMVNNCLDDNTQFRYLDSELLHNIEKKGTFASSYGKSPYQNRLFIYDGKNACGISFGNSNEHRLKQRASGSLFLYDSRVNSCAQPNGKYVDQKKAGCNDAAEQKFTFGSVTQYNTKMKDVHCSPIQLMMVKKADYGDFNNSGTFDGSATSDTKCSIITNCQVKSLCGGNRSCELTIDNNLLSSLYCPETTKELYTEYTCVDIYTSPITTAPNIRLTGQNTGFIEIKDGSTWREVDEENWDKNRQKMLCQHLGFDETDTNDISTKQIGKNQKISTGDLICYNTQPSGTSCCVHLQPSTTTSKVNISYAECKMCDKPALLQDETIFPDFVFSGSGSNSYSNARFNKNGWCTAINNPNYLLIDLQKEYHITRVVTMGNKDLQTRWIGRYSMTYSRDDRYTNSKQMSGNKNGYQASITRFDIYNVKHIKIQSTEKTDFCLRIELCGEVQTPAPVYDIAVTPADTSAQVTWKIRTAPEESSYITHYNIYIDGKSLQRISRKTYSTKFTIPGLKPYTMYKVEIETEDGYGQKSNKVSENFETIEAVPSGPPLDVAFTSRGKNSLKVSWKLPEENLRNGKLTGYQVCYSTRAMSENSICTPTDTTLSYTINTLQPSTKYFVTVSAGTSVGFGTNSSEISKITNGEPVNPVAASSSRLGITITKPATYIKEVMVIVQIATKDPTPSENIRTSELNPHHQTKTQDPYITAYLKDDVLPLTFVIGDGKEYNLKNKKYFNEPLEPNSSYIVFLRFFESQKESYYSTEWSNSVRAMAIPPAPVISKITSTGPKVYNISWSQPTLPDQQTVLKYHANYSALNGPSKTLDVSKEIRYIIIDVDYYKQYTFEIQVETEAGRSNTTSKSWLSHSEPLKHPEKTEDGYTVTLRKPKKEQKIKTVALVLLLSKSSKPVAPEDVKLENSPPSDKKADNVAFIAKKFNISEFQGDTIEISLRESKDERRRRREAIEIYALEPSATYRTTQLNTDESGNRLWSYWSEPFTVGGAPTIDNGDGGGSTGAAVGASVGVVVIVVALVLAVIFFRTRRTHKRYKVKEIGSEENYDERKGIDNEYIEGRHGAMPDDQPANGNDEGIYSNETTL